LPRSIQRLESRLSKVIEAPLNSCSRSPLVSSKPLRVETPDAAPVVDGVGVAVRRGDGDRGGLDVVAGAVGPADGIEEACRVRIVGVEDEPVGLQQVVRLAVGEVQADHEVRQQGVLDAEQQLVGQRRVQVGIDRVRLQRLQGERIDVAARRRDLRAEVVGIDRRAVAAPGQESSGRRPRRAG